jgi:ring-1,2-phenylacetyl-CoA epoxidase subunit PaaB
MARSKGTSGPPPAVGAPATDGAGGSGDSQWPLWEVFTQSAQGAPHEHAGSLHAVDAEMALQNARDVYARRGGVVSIWVVPSVEITASPSDEAGPFFDPGADKIYRHPQFYKVPRGLKGF